MDNLQLAAAAKIIRNRDGVLLRSKKGAFQLHGPDIAELLANIEPLLRGQHTVQTICDSLPHYADDNIELLLNVLIKHGVIETNANFHTGSYPMSPPWAIHERFIKNSSLSTLDSTANLTDKQVLIIGLEAWSINIVEELAHCGVGNIHIVDNGRITEEDITLHRDLHPKHIGESRAEVVRQSVNQVSPWCEVSHERLLLDRDDAFAPLRHQPWHFVINCLPNESGHLLKRTSSYCHTHKIPAFYGHIEGNESWLGPLVIPGETACWNCMRLRRIGASDNPQLTHVLENCALQADTPPHERSFLSPMATMSSQQITIEALKFLLGISEKELRNQVRVTHLLDGEVTRIPVAPIPWCDVCGGVDEHEFQPPTQGNMAFIDRPDQSIRSIEELKHLFSGWVDSTVDAIRSLQATHTPLPSVLLEEAHSDALIEAEQRVAVRDIDHDTLRCCAANQLNGEVLTPSQLPLYSKRQYDSPSFPFSPWQIHKSIYWAQGYWYGTETPVFVPAIRAQEQAIFQHTDSGLGVGDDFCVAAMYSCYNLIKHDALMITWYGQQPCTRLALSPALCKDVQPLINRILRKGMDLELYLLDVGLHIPVIACLALGSGIETPAISTTLACHGDIHIAMRHAIEQQTYALFYRSYIMAFGLDLPQQPHQVRSRKDHAAFYCGDHHKAAFDFMRQPQQQAINAEDWEHPVLTTPADLRTRLQDHGIDIAIVDITPVNIYMQPCAVTQGIAKQLQPIHYGEHYKRSFTARLGQVLAAGGTTNPYPHPLS